MANSIRDSEINDNTPASDRTLRRFLLTAFVCGLAPLVGGIAFFFAWILTEWPVFEGLGMLNAGVGVVCAAIGAFCCAVYLGCVIFSAETRRLRKGTNGVLAGVAILMNFPAFAAILGAVDKIESGRRAIAELQTNYLHLINDSGHVIEELKIAGSNQSIEFKNVSARSSHTCVLAQQNELHLTGTMKRAGKETRLSTDIAASGSRIGDIVLVIKPDLSVSSFRIRGSYERSTLIQGD